MTNAQIFFAALGPGLLLVWGIKRGLRRLGMPSQDAHVLAGMILVGLGVVLTVIGLVIG